MKRSDERFKHVHSRTPVQLAKRKTIKQKLTTHFRIGSIKNRSFSLLIVSKTLKQCRQLSITSVKPLLHKDRPALNWSYFISIETWKALSRVYNCVINTIYTIRLLSMSTSLLLLCCIVAVNAFQVLATEVTFKGREYFSYNFKIRPAITTNKNAISLRFKTIHPSGLMLYSRGISDYIKLELLNGVLK